MFDTFYATGAQICFALLGLWWVVVQFKYDEFMRDPQRRRTAYNISLYFVLPGIMSLFSLLADEITLIWRAAFVAAGVLGIIEMVMMVRGGTNVGSPMARSARWGALLLYILIVFFALVPETARSVGIPPQLVEGTLLGLLVFLGVQMAWLFFIEDRNNPA